MEKITTIKQYLDLAGRTCANLETKELDMLHMNMGIITEVAETLDAIKKHIAYGKPLDVVNIGEELADTAWYVANKSRMFLPEILKEAVWGNDNVFYETLKDYRQDTDLQIESLSDVCNVLAILMPRDTLDEVSENIMDKHIGIPAIVILHEVAEYFKLDFFQLLTNNISKLQVRYPEKFTNENALNRDLSAERVELEK